MHVNFYHRFVSVEQLRLFLFRFLKEKTGQVVFIGYRNTDILWKNFCSLFNVHVAAGGLVYNMQQQWLFIKRLGFYDLPKGHVEKGETIEDTALREVAEECGVDNLAIERFLLTTYHVYNTKSKIILKPSHWYLMKYMGNNTPKPQVSENITEAFFTPAGNIPALLTNTYGSIIEVVQKAAIL